VDGSSGEGGGQLLRTAVALAAVTGTSIRIHSIRAGREPEGMAPQHVAAVRAVAELCGARTRGLELRSREIEFAPGPLRAGDFSFDVGTAGSVTLVLQAVLPVMIATGREVSATVAGGTDVRAAPPLDYLCRVLLPLLRRMGARVEVETLRRGYYPRGGGVVRVVVKPGGLRPLRLAEPGRLLEVRGIAHVAHLQRHIAERMGAAAIGRLSAAGIEAHCEIIDLDPAQAVGSGGAVVCWAVREHTVVGAGRVAERGVPAEDLGIDVGERLVADVAAGATLDVHAADQLLVYCGIAGGESRCTARALTPHARTAMWLIESLLGTRFETTEAGGITEVTVISGRSK